MKTKYTYKQIWTIAYPILISLIMEQMIGMTDTAFLGRVGEIELGASAIAGVYYLAIFMMAFGFSIGAQILIARRNGEGNYKEIGPIFYQGIYFLLAVAVILFTLSIVFSPHILRNIISSPHIYDAAESYIHWRVYGFFFSFVMVMFRAFFVGTTQTKTLTLNSIVMVLSNVVFNYILIFGKFGFPQLGIAGAAIGSSLAEMVSVIFFIIYTWKRIEICIEYITQIPEKDIEADSQCFGVDDDSEFCFFVHLVHVLPVRRTSGRTLTGYRQYYPQRIGNTVYDCNGFCRHLRFAGQQPHRGGRTRLCSRDRQTTYPYRIRIRIANIDFLLSVSRPDSEYLHGYAGAKGCLCTFIMGVVLRLSGVSTRQCLFPIGIRYGKYADCIGYGTLRIGNLCSLCHVLHSLSENGCRFFLDNGKRVWYFHSALLLSIHEERKLAEKENLNSFFTIFARK